MSFSQRQYDVEEISRKRNSEEKTGEARKVLPSEAVEQGLKSTGRGLEWEERASMENRLNFDFARIRIHTDEKAAESARTLNAKAFTVGNDIVFAAGQYSPKTPAGRQLLNHELVHVVQQSRIQAQPSAVGFWAVSENDAIEREADAISANAEATEEMPPVNERVPQGQVHLKGAWESFKEWIGLGKTDEEEVLGDLKEGLEKAEKLCKAGAVVASDPKAQERLEKAGEAFGSVSKKIGKGLKAVGVVRDIYRFVNSVENLPSADEMYKNPASADKFDDVFSAAGALGKRLPPGPWSAYFDFLAGFKDFFKNMRKKLHPSERWKRQEEEAEIWH